MNMRAFNWFLRRNSRLRWSFATSAKRTEKTELVRSKYSFRNAANVVVRFLFPTITDEIEGAARGAITISRRGEYKNGSPIEANISPNYSDVGLKGESRKLRGKTYKNEADCPVFYRI